MDEPEHQPRDVSADNYPPLPRRAPTFNTGQEFEKLRFFIETNLRDIHDSVTGRIDSVRGDIQSLSHILHVEDGRGTSGKSNGAAMGGGPEGWGMMTRWGRTPPQPAPNNAALELERRLQELQARLRAVETERDGLGRERDRAQQQSELFQRRFGEAEQQKRKQQELNVQLKNIIIRSGNSDSEPLDSVIIEAFCEIRALIQKIVHKHYQYPPARLDKTRNSLFERQKMFFKSFPELPESIQRFRARAKIFELLDEEILSRPCFELCGEMERNFQDFEAALSTSHKGSPTDIAEWRRRTVECAGWLRAESRTPKRTADLIQNFMDPLLAPTPKALPQGEPSPTNVHDKTVLQLCEDTFRLAILLRKSKANFRCEMQKMGTLIDGTVEADIAPQAFDGQPGPVLGSKVAFTIFGALVKYSGYALDERHVLERAHVICRG